MKFITMATATATSSNGNEDLGDTIDNRKPNAAPSSPMMMEVVDHPPKEQSASRSNEDNNDGSPEEHSNAVNEVKTYFMEPQKPSHLDTMQMKLVDTVFEELFGYKWGTMFEINNDDKADASSVGLVLRDIVGSKPAAKILYHTNQMGKRVIISTGTERATTNGEFGMSVKRNHPGKRQRRVDDDDNTTAIARIQNQQQQHQTEQLMKNQSISTTSVSTKSLEETFGNRNRVAATKQIPVLHAGTAVASGTAVAGGVDSLLQQLSNPNTKLSTVAKTSNDWEHFKSQHVGLGDKLEEHIESKDSYLKRQEFLSRVDNRQFDMEKNVRNKERAKRGM